MRKTHARCLGKDKSPNPNMPSDEPILAWALLELLQRQPNLPDVDINMNCRDKPGSSRRGGGFFKKLPLLNERDVILLLLSCNLILFGKNTKPPPVSYKASMHDSTLDWNSVHLPTVPRRCRHFTRG